MMQIVPAIFDKQFDEAQEKIALVKNDFRWIQIDVTDNIFTPGKTFELELLNKLDFDTSHILWNIHLMVKEPIKWIQKCNFVGATRIIGQVEMMDNKDEFIKEAKDANLEAGLAFDIESEINNIPEETDEVLLMGRKAGFESLELNQKVFDKIKQLKKIREENGCQFKISVDGGINLENIKKLKEAGIEIAYCTSAIFNGLVKENVEELNKQIK